MLEDVLQMKHLALIGESNAKGSSLLMKKIRGRAYSDKDNGCLEVTGEVNLHVFLRYFDKKQAANQTAWQRYYLPTSYPGMFCQEG